jgi:type III secretory pathway lipoprotein EscJ
MIEDGRRSNDNHAPESDVVLLFPAADVGADVTVLDVKTLVAVVFVLVSLDNVTLMFSPISKSFTWNDTLLVAL